MNYGMFDLIWPVIRNKFLPNNIPFFCTFILTWRCNAKCIMCDIWKKEKSGELDILDIDKILKEIREVRVIRLTGGEPFLREDLIKIVNLIAENTKTRIVQITTNGLLKEKITNFIKSNTHKNIHLKISLHGYEANHDKIMQYNGAYGRALETIDTLNGMKEKYKFYLAITQTITDMESYHDSKKIRLICQKLRLPYLPVIAYKNANLYKNEQDIKTAETSFICYGNFSKKDLETVLKDLMASTKKIDNFYERIVKKYYLKGLYNRLILGRNRQNPECVALRNHIRLLPNADIPVCLYNPQIAGNLLEHTLKDIWDSAKIKRLRKQIVECKGCWVACEVIPSAIFGDIYEGFFD